MLFIACAPAKLAALLSMTVLLGMPVLAIGFLKNVLQRQGFGAQRAGNLGFGRHDQQPDIGRPIPFDLYIGLINTP